MYFSIMQSFIGARALCCAHYGEGSGPIHISGVSCLGTEPNITSCAYLTNTSQDQHYKDVSVHCQQGTGSSLYSARHCTSNVCSFTAPTHTEEGEIRLVNGSYAWEGRVEIYLSDRKSVV